MLPFCQTQARLFLLQDRCQVRLDGSPSEVGRRGQSQGHDQQQALPGNARGPMEHDGPAEGLLVDLRLCGNLFAREKSPKVSVLEAESSCQRHDSTSFLGKINFPKI
jgi:hypothetical protein